MWCMMFEVFEALHETYLVEIWEEKGMKVPLLGITQRKRNTITVRMKQHNADGRENVHDSDVMTLN